MTTWLGRIRRAVLMAVTWAVVWAPLGVLIGMIVDPDGSMDEPWVAVGAYPGFLCGVVFSAVLGITDSRRRLDELSLPRAAAWGAVSGLLVPVLFVLAVAMGLGTPRGGHTPWGPLAVITGATILGSAVAASVSLALARWWKGRSEGSSGTQPLSSN